MFLTLGSVLTLIQETFKRLSLSPDLKLREIKLTQHNEMSTLLSEIHMNTHVIMYFCYDYTFHMIFLPNKIG